MSLLPKDNNKNIEYSYFHILDQGNENSNGCGYYTVYTAMLLTYKPELLNHESGQILFDNNYDKNIRAELSIMTMLYNALSYEKGLEEVEVNGTFRSPSKFIFHNLGHPNDKSLKKELILRLKI